MAVRKTLTVAGSDSGGGAGIQADLKTFAALGCYGTSVITAITAQNTHGVRGVQECTPAMVVAQLDAVLEDIGCDAAKTGMLANQYLITTVAGALRRHGVFPLVVDPVMVAKGGARLLTDNAIASLGQYLLPIATVITPNLPEASQLLNKTIVHNGDMKSAITELGNQLPCSVLLKGGHSTDGEVLDLLWHEGRLHQFSSERLTVRHTHGTGCTLSAAIAAYLAQGADLPLAVEAAREYLLGAMKNAYPIGLGIGPVNHFWNTASTHILDPNSPGDEHHG